MGCPRIYFVAIKRPKDMDNSEHENPNPRPKWLAIADNGLGSVISGAALISATFVLVLMILVTTMVVVVENLLNYLVQWVMVMVR